MDEDLFRRQMRDLALRPLSTAEAMAVLRRVRFQHPPFPIQMEVSDTRPLWLRLETTVRHRDSGAVTEVQHINQIPEWLTEPQLIAFVHGALRRAFNHEVDECFIYDGVRLFDPHGEDESP